MLTETIVGMPPPVNASSIYCHPDRRRLVQRAATVVFDCWALRMRNREYIDKRCI